MRALLIDPWKREVTTIEVPAENGDSLDTYINNLVEGFGEEMGGLDNRDCIVADVQVWDKWEPNKYCGFRLSASGREVADEVVIMGYGVVVGITGEISNLTTVSAQSSKMYLMNRLEFMTAKEVDAWGLRADQLSKEDFGPRMLVSDYDKYIADADKRESALREANYALDKENKKLYEMNSSIKEANDVLINENNELRATIVNWIEKYKKLQELKDAQGSIISALSARNVELNNKLESIRGSRDSDNRHLVGVIKQCSIQNAENNLNLRELKLREQEFQLKVAKFNKNIAKEFHFKLEE
jgi:hypothetical protein